MRSSRLYCWTVIGWAILAGLAIPFLVTSCIRGWHHSTLTGVLLSACAAFILYFWLNGAKDITYTLGYHLGLRRRPNPEPRAADWGGSYPRVVLIYCTRNDFSAASLLASMDQDYPNFEVVILDDSSEESYLNEVAQFGADNGARVVRRVRRNGFKAGNMNNFLRSADYDFFVILDSDEIIPADFINRALPYFADRRVGIVQANHIATRNQNGFMARYALGVESHWRTYQAMKNRFGFLSLLGHGAMVSKECYDTVGGFPHLVAEDLCFSIEARNHGYYTVFAEDIVCEEEFPVDYLAFKKRHSKWTQGNMEFVLKYSWKILRSKMTWYEKLDIVLFTYGLPLTGLFSLFMIIEVIVLPTMRYPVNYPVWMLAPTLAFLVAPLLNDIISNWRMRKRDLASYLVHSMLLYGSMYFVSLRSSVKATYGGAEFVVTPKTKTGVAFSESVLANRADILCALVLCAVASLTTHSVLPVLLVVGPAFFGPYLSVLHSTNRQHRRHRRSREVADPYAGGPGRAASTSPGPSGDPEAGGLAYPSLR